MDEQARYLTSGYRGSPLISSCSYNLHVLNIYEIYEPYNHYIITYTSSMQAYPFRIIHNYVYSVENCLLEALEFSIAIELYFPTQDFQFGRCKVSGGVRDEMSDG